MMFILVAMSAGVVAQDIPREGRTADPDEPTVPEQVDIQPTSDDPAIRDRLSGILTSTGWFTDIDVEVNDGVVFLRGMSESVEYKNWAGELARNTQDVTAVVNQIEIVEPDIWNYEPAVTGLQELWQSIMRSVPFWIFGMLVLLLFWGISLLVAGFTRASLVKRNVNTLLQDIVAKGVAVLVFLVGLYVVFHVADLTNIAFTILGGTGLLGIILGIAFRDITENFLASIFLSIQNPFHAGDLVEINGNTGFVQRLTIRATLMMTLDGNHLQIPNSIVYKNSILNFSSNPNQRTTFTVGIGYDDSITKAQEIGAKILADHPAVLSEPEPWVLVDELAASTVNIQFYFWVDGSKHNLFKVQSSVLRLVKTAYQKEGISMPDEAREMTFPHGVPVQLSNAGASAETSDDKITTTSEQRERKIPAGSQLSDDSKVITESEGELHSNDEEIQEQARRSRSPEEGENLLKPE